MSYALTAVKRNSTGRRAKHVQDEGNIPAVIYGSGKVAINIQIPKTDFRKVYREAGMSSLIDMTIDGLDSVKAIIKEVQVNPMTMAPYHVDFHQIRMDQEMEAEVPLTIVGESAAVKGAAGTLVRPLHTVHVRCLPANLPHEIQVDISVLATFEDTITVADLKLPQGVTVRDDATATVVSVVPPLTEDQLKAWDAAAATPIDVSAVKTEAEVKKAEEDAKKAAEEAAAK